VHVVDVEAPRALLYVPAGQRNGLMAGKEIGFSANAAVGALDSVTVRVVLLTAVTVVPFGNAACRMKDPTSGSAALPGMTISFVRTLF